ncbi:Transmembrane osmosensor [Ascosphaera acerosa]|nr:Transmembrane osmosensor [Ascosphaera acerosa]
MPQIDMLNITGDPFALITISVAVIGWIIAFVAAILTDIQHDFANHSWWTIGFMFMVIIGALWIFYFGSAPFTGARRWIDSFSNKEYPSYGASSAARDKFPMHHGSGVSTSAGAGIGHPQSGAYPQPLSAGVGGYAGGGDGQHGYGHSLTPMHSNPSRAGHGYSDSFAAAGTPNHVYTTGVHGRGSVTPVSVSGGHPRGPYPGDGEDELAAGAGVGAGVGAVAGPDPRTTGGAELEEDIPVPTAYPHRAKAIYTYEANPEDANEIGFLKNEILEVSDISGRWWQARKANGETGIAPSNYLILL